MADTVRAFLIWRDANVDADVVKRFTQIANCLKVHTIWENLGHRIWKATLPEQNICIKIVNIDWGV